MNGQIQTERFVGYSGLYLERSGVHAARLAEVLLEPPAYPLSDAEKAEVRQFEADMLKTQVGIGTNLEDVLSYSLSEESEAPLFFAEGLMEGGLIVNGAELPHFSSKDEAYRWVAASGLDKKQLLELSKKSTGVYKSKSTQALLQEEDIPETVTEARSLVLDPKGFSEKMRNIEAARTMLHEWRSVAVRGNPIDDAKVAYSDIFLAKINAQLASGIPIVGTLSEQAMFVDDSEIGQLCQTLVSPGLLVAMKSSESRQRLFRRLDFLRNGIGYDIAGKATAVAHELETGTTELPSGGIFSVEQMRRMQEIMLESEEMQQIFKGILGRANQLSEEDSSTWSPDRAGRATDGLFQVVINPDKATFAVGSKTGVYKVASEPRSLYDVMIVGGFHELEHISQSIADDAAGEKVKIASIQGKRVSGLREGGANMRQREAEQKFFGFRKPYADTYADALEVLEAGGSLGSAVKAFYDAKLRAMPDVNKPAAAREAADRVLRLIRVGINSQPMAYAEESIMAHELTGVSTEVQRRAMAVTGLDLVDQVRLHNFGLLDIAEVTKIDWTTHILDELNENGKFKDIVS